MQQFPYAYAVNDDWQQAVERCLEQLGEPSEGNALGFVYVSDRLAASLEAILGRLKEGSGVDNWVGSVGMGICAADQEFYEQAAIAVMIASLPEDSYRIISDIESNRLALLGEDENWLIEDELHVVLLHGDPRRQDIGETLEQLPGLIPNGYAVGGISSSSHGLFQVANNEIESNRISGVVFNQQVSLITGLTQGCTPIGPVHEVSSAERNIVVKLDERPALEVFKEDIGELLARDMERVGETIFAGLPISGADKPDYLVRNMLGVDENNQLLAIGDYVTEGDALMFCRRDGNSAQEDMRRMLEDLKRRLPGKSTTAIKGAVYVSCLGRGREIFGSEGAELGLIREVLGEIPLVGFFANGEISANRLYGYTGVLTLFI